MFSYCFLLSFFPNFVHTISRTLSYRSRLCFTADWTLYILHTFLNFCIFSPGSYYYHTVADNYACAKLAFLRLLKMQFHKNPYIPNQRPFSRKYNANFVFRLSDITDEIFTLKNPLRIISSIGIFKQKFDSLLFK